MPGGLPGGEMLNFRIDRRIRKIKYSTTEQKHMELYTKTINLIKNIDDRATLQMLNTKLRINQNNLICGAEEKQPRLKKQHRLSQE